MKKILIIIALFLGIFLSFTFCCKQINTRVTKYDLPKGNLKWSSVYPTNAKACFAAAFTNPLGNIEGSYICNGQSVDANNKLKVSLINNTFNIARNWNSNNGFQQLVLVSNYLPKKFKDTRKAFRRALCKSEKDSFIIESNYPMTLTSFAYYCSQHCKDAVYLDMGEFGYGFIKNKPLHILGLFTRHKQTNWLYIE